MTFPPQPATLTQDIVALTRQRTVAELLHFALHRLVAISGAVGATLFFYSAKVQTPRTLRWGVLPTEALVAVEQWERTVLQRLEQGLHHTEVTGQTALQSGHILLGIPLTHPDTVTGNVVLLLPPGGRLGDDLYDAIRTLCTATASQLDMLQELEHTRRQLDRLGLLYEVGQSLGSTLDLSALLQKTMALAGEVMKAQASTLMLLDPADPTYLVFEIAHGTTREQLRRYRMPVTEGVAGWVARHGEAVIVNAPDHDPRFNRRVDLRTGFLTRNILCVPMKIKGETIGVLQVLNKSGAAGFEREDLDLLLTVAGQAAVAVDNARLLGNLLAEQDYMLAAEEEVRKALARSLHDGTVQLLAAMLMSLDHARLLAERKPADLPAELDNLTDLANRALREARTLLFELRPLVLETQGLWAALPTYAERLNQEGHGVMVRVELPADLPRLDTAIERTLFDIVQEAVGNARKHARASQILIQVQAGAENLTLFVRDDGVGFDMAAVQSRYEQSGSLGLLNMRERAQWAEARYHLTSTPGKGTQVTVRVPHRRARQERTF